MTSTVDCQLGHRDESEQRCLCGAKTKVARQYLGDVIHEPRVLSDDELTCKSLSDGSDVAVDLAAYEASPEAALVDLGDRRGWRRLK